MCEIQKGDFVTINPEWLKACGMSALIGIPQEITRIEDLTRGGWFPDRVMYHLKLSNGRDWIVWKIRGVTKAN